MRQTIRRILKGKSGATSIEYALIATLISLAIVGGVGQAGNSLEFLWGNNDSKLRQALDQNQ